MKSKEEFIKLVDNRFFKHLRTNSLIPFGEKGKRTEYLSFVYDNFIFNECQKRDAAFLRYADDQIIFAKTREDAEELIYMASHKLFKEGLNINTGKTKEFTNFQEFDDVYGFSIFEKLKFSDQDVNQAFERFIIKKDSCVDFRKSSALKRLLHNKIKIENLHNQKLIKLLSYLLD